MEEDFKLLGYWYMHLIDGGDSIGEGIRILQKYGLVDEEGYWVGEEVED